MADVLIAGGGIAGSSLAIMFGQKGVAVQLFEKARFPREKPCGEGLMPEGAAVLQRLGLIASVAGGPFYGVRFHFEGQAGQFKSPKLICFRSPGFGQRRWVLDQLLLSAAAATPGVQVHTGARVDGPITEKGTVVGLRVAGQELRAPLLIGPQRQIAVCILAHKAGHLRPTIDFLSLCRRFPVLTTRLDGAEQITPVRGAFPLTRHVRKSARRGAVLLGDAAGFLDPSTGTGMTQALITAELLSGYINCRRTPDWTWLRSFEYRRRSVLRAHRILTRGLLWLYRSPRLARRLLSVPAHCSFLFPTEDQHVDEGISKSRLVVWHRLISASATRNGGGKAHAQRC